LDKYIQMSRGEAKGSQRAKLQIWANTTEAVIGAIYLDQGYVVAQKFIAINIIKWLDEIIKTGAWQDANFIRLYEERGQPIRVNENSQATLDLRVITQ